MVRLTRHWRGVLVFFATLIVSVPATAARAETGETLREGAAQTQRAAAGWLRLELDQREARARAAPATPRERMRQDTLDWQEAIRLREIQQREERALQSARRQARQPSLDVVPNLEDGSDRLRSRARTVQQEQIRDAQRSRMRGERRASSRLPESPGWRSRAPLSR